MADIQFTPLEWVDTDDPVSPATPSDPKLDAETLNAREQFFGDLVDQVNALTGGVGAHELELAAKADLVGGKVPGSQLTDAGTGTKGIARILGGTPDAPTVPATALTGTIDDARIPSAITRDSELAAAVSGIIAGAPGALDTLDELAAAFGDDPNAIATITAALAVRLRVDAAQSLTSGQRQQARDNLGLATVSSTGAYADLSGKPTIPAAYSDEQAQDAVAALIAAGSHSGITFDYNGAANTLSATVSGGGGGGSYTDEQVRDVIGAALQQGTNVTISVNDAGDSITIGTSATALTVDGVPAATYDLDTTPVTPADIGAQPADDDLTTIAGLSSATAGAMVTDGAGWIRKTYAQLKTALGLVKADVGLGNVDNTADTAKPVSTAQQTALDAKAPTARTITAGAGLTGGGDLTANRTLAVSYGTTAGTSAQGNDARLAGVAALQKAAMPGTSLWDAGNVEAFSRFGANLNLTLTSGVLWLDYFYAPVDATITKLGFNTNSTGGSGITLCRLALFTVASDDAITKVAQTANTTSLGTGTYTAYQPALDTAGGFPASYTLTAGNRYAIGILQVATTPSSANGTDTGTAMGVAPVICRRATGQSDIGASYPAASLAAFYNPVYLFGTA